MNILCICDYGEVRSVAMAMLLTAKGHTAYAIGDNLNRREKYKLIKKADKVVLMNEGTDFLFKTNAISNKNKFLNGWIGRDDFVSATHPGLLRLCEQKIKELNL